MRVVAAAAFGTALAAAFYLLLIDTISAPELYAGCGVAVLAGAGFVAAREDAFPQAIKPQWLLGGWRVLAALPLHIALVCRDALAQPFTRSSSRGRFRVVRFRGGDAPSDRGRRALAESLGSFAPNTIVIGVDADRELLLVHQLHPRDGADELDVLELG
jgi:multisubunit Na+/H+ antiporter MnhE subunit